MWFEVSCPNCSQSFEIEDILLGEKLECSNCETRFMAERRYPKFLYVATPEGNILFTIYAVFRLIDSGELPRDVDCLSSDTKFWVSFNNLVATVPVDVLTIGIPDAEDVCPTAPEEPELEEEEDEDLLPPPIKLRIDTRVK